MSIDSLVVSLPKLSEAQCWILLKLHANHLRMRVSAIMFLLAREWRQLVMLLLSVRLRKLDLRQKKMLLLLLLLLVVIRVRDVKGSRSTFFESSYSRLGSSQVVKVLSIFNVLLGLGTVNWAALYFGLARHGIYIQKVMWLLAGGCSGKILERI